MSTQTKKRNYKKNKNINTNHIKNKWNNKKKEKGKNEKKYSQREHIENDSEIDSDEILSSVDSDNNNNNHKIVKKQKYNEKGQIFSDEDLSEVEKNCNNVYNEEDEEGEQKNVEKLEMTEDEDNANIFMSEHERKMYLAKKYLKDLGINSDDSKSTYSNEESEEENVFEKTNETNDKEEKEEIWGNKKKEITNRLIEENHIKNKENIFQLNNKIKIVIDEKMSTNAKNYNTKKNDKIVEISKIGDNRVVFYKGHKNNVTCVGCPSYGLSFFDQYRFVNTEKSINQSRYNTGKFYEIERNIDSSDSEAYSYKYEDDSCEQEKNIVEPKVFENTSIRTVYSGGNDRSIIEWDVERGEKIHIYKGEYDSFLKYGEEGIPHFKGVMDICCNKYNSYFLSVGCDNLINLWDCRDKRKCTKSFIGHKHIITGIENCTTFSNPSTEDYNFYTSSYDKTIKQWDIRFFDKCINTYYGHTNKILSMNSVNLNNIITGSDDYTLRVWNMKLDSHMIFNLNYEIIDACCALNNSIFVAGTFSGHIYIFSKAHKNPIGIKQNVHSKKPLTALISIPSTNVFISGSYDGFIHFWKYKHIDKKTCCIKIFQSIPINGVVNQFSFSHNYKYLFVAIGNQMKHGCWVRTKDKTGLAIIPLQYID